MLLGDAASNFHDRSKEPEFDCLYSVVVVINCIFVQAMWIKYFERKFNSKNKFLHAAPTHKRFPSVLLISDEVFRITTPLDSSIDLLYFFQTIRAKGPAKTMYSSVLLISALISHESCMLLPKRHITLKNLLLSCREESEPNFKF